jgi:hypothetical protein
MGSVTSLRFSKRKPTEWRAFSVPRLKPIKSTLPWPAATNAFPKCHFTPSRYRTIWSQFVEIVDPIDDIGDDDS